MTVRVLLFAAAKAAIGSPAIELALAEPARVADVRAELHRRFPDLRGLLARSWIAVNQRVAPADADVQSHDEIAWIPPASGG